MTVPETLSHEEAIELLPWLVNGSLPAGERDGVREHAASCVICRRELVQLEALNDSIAAGAARAACAAPDMRRINARIDAELERDRRGGVLLSKLRDWMQDPWLVAFAAQSLVLVVLVSVWLPARGPEAEFTTLTEPSILPVGNYVRVVFDPTLDAGAVADLLDDRPLAVFDGPSPRGVYTLRLDDDVPAAARSTIAAELLDQPGVLFAQPVTER